MLNLLFNEPTFFFYGNSFLDVKCQCPNETLSFDDVLVEVKVLGLII